MANVLKVAVQHAIATLLDRGRSQRSIECVLGLARESGGENANVVTAVHYRRNRCPVWIGTAVQYGPFSASWEAPRDVGISVFGVPSPQLPSETGSPPKSPKSPRFSCRIRSL